MAHIYIFSPSSAVRDKAAFRRGVKRLKALGHDVEVDEAALASHMRFAGDDATRLAALDRAYSRGHHGRWPCPFVFPFAFPGVGMCPFTPAARWAAPR